tara:strand:+ start:4681 stop:5454 length:774 start_codon:yes stop_codon:yes gene_type:complete
VLIEFYKYQGTGNDFVVIDDRDSVFDIDDKRLISALCERRMGIGADGLILLRGHKDLDFEMIYFNSDGNQSSMCGNGGRCIVAFANLLGIISSEANFMAIDGVHKAKINRDNISLKMKDVSSIDLIANGFVLDTGSPHYVKIVDDLDVISVEDDGESIRNLPFFKREGINVNFALCSDELSVRTYERGVEAETLSCGTGVVATAIAMHNAQYVNKESVLVHTRGGVLCVDFKLVKDSYINVWLSGEVDLVYAGEFEC